MQKERMHSVVLNPKLCKGCVNCIKHCPTEAIRIRSGKAIIIEEKCIDCGETLLLTERNWVRRRRANDGFAPRCKKCEKIRRKGG